MAEKWTRTGAPLPRVGDEAALAAHWQRWRDAVCGTDDPAAASLAGDPAVRALLDAVFANSPYLSRSLIVDPPAAARLLQCGPEPAFAGALGEITSTGTESTDALMKRLRLAKRRAALAIGVADITQAWSLDRITGALSTFAEAALGAACRHLLKALHDSGRMTLPRPEDPEHGSGLIVLGMGKLGARELNYSSDIDLIILYDQAAAPAPSDAMPRLFNRLARGLVRIMDERTAHGYVFRTDLRLRPDPASTPLALSEHAARIYYETAGRTWERAAMIKARAVAGDRTAGAAFLETLRPFIWRRHLDFPAVQDIQAIKRQIDAARDSGPALTGFSVKLGRGGIREIEFFAQAQQLVWGGRNPELRVPGTVPALAALAAAGHVPPRAVAELRSAYRFLRNLEHRLQMVDDRQTHSLPDNDAGLARIAAFSTFEAVPAFIAALRASLQSVQRRCAALFAEPVEEADAAPMSFADPDHDPDTLAALGALGYAEPRRALDVVRGWLGGKYPAVRAARTGELLEQLAPSLLRAFADAPDPDTVLQRFDGVVARLPGGLRLFSLLAARPELLGLIAEIMGVAPRLADRLARRPELLDSVLSRDFADLDLPDDAGMDPETVETARRGLVRLYYAREFGPGEMRDELANAARDARDVQDLMSVQRRWANDRVFQIGVHVLRGLLSPVEAARPLSDIADTCLKALMPLLEDTFAAAHGYVPGGKVAVVAFGKLGSREMTVTSDLDLLFLYDHEAGGAASDGARPLAPSHYYARLCRRLIGAVSAPTAEGKLYEVDMRLRPSGNAGPIACSLETFVEYHRSSAWTWEHQALTRARVVYATDGLGEQFERARMAVLTRPREHLSLAADITSMRERIRREKGDGSTGSIVHRRGGLLDVEFAAQFLQLAHAAEAPDILARDAVSVFRAASSLGVLQDDAASDLAEAAALWRNLQGILRLTIGGETIAHAAAPALKGVLGGASGSLVFDALADAVEDTSRRASARFDSLVSAGP